MRLETPLNSLHIYMQLIEREVRQMDEPVRRRIEEHLRVCQGEIRRLDQIVNQFLKAVRPTPSVLEPRSANEISMRCWRCWSRRFAIGMC